MNISWSKLIVSGIVIIAVVVLAKKFTVSETKPQEKPKTFYEIAAEDDKRLRAEIKTDRPAKTEQEQQEISPEEIQAEKLFENKRMKSRFACNNTECCRRGASDMVGEPKRHFVVQRMTEVQRLSQIPRHLRAQQFLDEVIRPASDLVVQAQRIDPSLERARHRLEDWRTTISSLANEQGSTTFSAVPQGRRVRHLRGA